MNGKKVMLTIQGLCFYHNERETQSGPRIGRLPVSIGPNAGK